MSATAERAAEWVYRGVWGVLTSCFNVPRDPPALPAAPGETVRAFKPSPRFVSYQKLYFWIFLAIVDAGLTLAWVVVLVASPLAGVLLLPLYLILAVVPDVLAYVAIHLRYDSTWYVLSDRSMRLRRGIWIIHETTITYENIQNIGIRQGPVQSHFGIATLTVHTAGGGAAAAGGKGGSAGTTGSHLGMIEGITDARELRDQIMARVEASRAAGIGDEHHGPVLPTSPARGLVFRTEHLAVLAEIRALLRSPEQPS
jgi:membrane protein YdbS with pleckstrin-like domain